MVEEGKNEFTQNLEKMKLGHDNELAEFKRKLEKVEANDQEVNNYIIYI